MLNIKAITVILNFAINKHSTSLKALKHCMKCILIQVYSMTATTNVAPLILGIQLHCCQQAILNAHGTT